MRGWAAYGSFSSGFASLKLDEAGIGIVTLPLTACSTKNSGHDSHVGPEFFYLIGEIRGQAEAGAGLTSRSEGRGVAPRKIEAAAS